MKRNDLSRRILPITLGLAIVVGVASAAKADLPSEPGDVPRSSLAPTDYKLVKYLHALSDLAVSAGQLAEKNGSTTAVRNFGATLVSDHTAGDQELLAYAKNAGIDARRMKNEPAPPEMQAYLQRLDRLRTLTGQQFDHEFALTMREGYARTIALVQSTQPHLANRNLAALLDRRLPTLDKNYQTAAGLASQQAPSSPERQPQPNTNGTDRSQRPAPATTH